jgi:hypothetical protein
MIVTGDLVKHVKNTSQFWVRLSLGSCWGAENLTIMNPHTVFIVAAKATLRGEEFLFISNGIKHGWILEMFMRHVCRLQ